MNTANHFFIGWVFVVVRGVDQEHNIGGLRDRVTPSAIMLTEDVFHPAVADAIWVWLVCADAIVAAVSVEVLDI